MDPVLLQFVQNFALIYPPKGQGKTKHVNYVLDQMQKFNLFISCELAESVCEMSCSKWWVDQAVVVLALNVRYIEWLFNVEYCIQSEDNHPWLKQLNDNNPRYRTILSTENCKLQQQVVTSALEMDPVRDIVDLQKLHEASYPLNDEWFFNGTSIRTDDVNRQIRWIRSIQTLFQRHLPRTNNSYGFDTVRHHYEELQSIDMDSTNKLVMSKVKPLITHLDAHTAQGNFSMSASVDSMWLENEAEELKLKRGKHFPPIPGHDPNRPWKSQGKRG